MQTVKRKPESNGAYIEIYHIKTLYTEYNYTTVLTTAAKWTLKASIPWNPSGPGGPVNPTGPAGPWKPVAPVRPVKPVTPVTPVAPGPPR